MGEYPRCSAAVRVLFSMFLEFRKHKYGEFVRCRRMHATEEEVWHTCAAQLRYIGGAPCRAHVGLEKVHAHLQQCMNWLAVRRV